MTEKTENMTKMLHFLPVRDNNVRSIDKYLQTDERERKNMIDRKMKNNPRCVLVFVDRVKECDKELSHNKFMAKTDQTVGYFIYTIRQRLAKQGLREDEALFWYVEDPQTPNSFIMVLHSKLMVEFHNEYKNKDGLLIMYYGFENAFGSVFPKNTLTFNSRDRQE